MTQTLRDKLEQVFSGPATKKPHGLIEHGPTKIGLELRNWTCQDYGYPARGETGQYSQRREGIG